MNTHTKFMLLFSMLALTALHAQKTRFGLKAGVNFSTLTENFVDVDGHLTYKPGFHIGALAQISMHQKWTLQPEVLFSNQGYKNTHGSNEIIGNMNYIAIPIMFLYAPVKKLSIQAGPQLSFLLSHKAKVRFYEFDEFDPLEPIFADSATFDLADSSQTVELGFNLGLAYQVTQNLFFSGRYNFGCTQATENNFTGKNDRNKVLQLSVGYLFN